MSNKILAATDFSPSARHALRVAGQIAVDRGDQLVVAHAWYIPALALGTEPFEIGGNVIQQMSDDAIRALDDDVQSLRRQCPAEITSVMPTGVPPWARIVELAEADPAIELIVLATHGRTGLPRVLLGSVAETVIRHAPCSVLVVRGDGEPAPFKSILCPVDFSASSRAAVDTACEMVRPGGSGITLLHVVEAPVARSGETYDLAFLRDIDKRAAGALEELAITVRAKVTVPVTTRTRLGYAGAQTLALLDDESFDLVAVGSHGRTGLSRVLLGSIAEKVARHASCPVLIARTRTN